MARRADFTMGEVKQLREAAELGEEVPLARVADVLEHVNRDFDLALTALTLSPRPVWVSEMLGLHPDRKVGA